jgi:hypothetical protein
LFCFTHLLLSFTYLLFCFTYLLFCAGSGLTPWSQDRGRPPVQRPADRGHVKV